MYSWENQSIDIVGSVDDTLQSSRNTGISKMYKVQGSEFFLGVDPVKLINGSDASFSLFYLIWKFVERCVNRESGIVLEGLFKRLLSNVGVGLFIDGKNGSAEIYIGNQKKKISSDENKVISEIYYTAEDLVRRELNKVYIEIGFQYISKYLGNGCPTFYGNLIDDELRLCTIDLEPGLYDVNCVYKMKMEGTYKNYFRGSSDWKIGRSLTKDMHYLVKRISGIVGEKSVGSRLILKEKNGSVMLIDETPLREKYRNVLDRLDGANRAEVEKLIYQLLGCFNSSTLIHSIRWDRTKSVVKWDYSRSSENNAIDVWIN